MKRVLHIWHLLNLPCEQITGLASESLDRELGTMEWFALRSHFLYCSACRRFMRQIQFLRRALRRVGTQIETEDLLAGPELPPNVRERIKRALRKD
jgi:predicted anti-sigma-YlaC factor YlaD